jgi:putative oxidoreductase
MSTNSTIKIRTTVIVVLKIFLCLTFLLIGVFKLSGTAQTIQLFEAIGWGQWFRYLTGILDIIGAVLLFLPRWTFYGALILVCTIGSATLFCLISLHNNPAVPLTLTLLAVLLALMTRSR